MNASVPVKTTTAHAIGQMIYERGPMTITAIFAVIEYGTSKFARRVLIESWVERGWFQPADDDKIDLTAFARTYLSGEAPKVDKPAFIGSMATGPQFNMLTRPPYKSPRRVVRADVPAWSVRPDGFGFKALSGACGVVA